MGETLDFLRVRLSAYSHSYDHFVSSAVRVLTFLKLPQKHELKWVFNAQQSVMDQYEIRFPTGGERNFVFRIASNDYNDIINQRLRRGMAREVNAVWYDRLPSVKNRKCIFDNCPTPDVESKVVQIGVHTVKGHLVKKTPVSTQQLKKAADESQNYKQYQERVEEIWRQKVCGQHCYCMDNE